MITLNTLLFGVLAGLISFKIVLLAAAAILLVHGLTQRARQRRVAPAPAPVRHRRLDVRA
jgi:hypothetical protein